jgi:Domain of unknown function (DUF3303)
MNAPNSVRNLSMLFMVIENFKSGNPRAVRERFLRDGRMLPEGVLSHGSWLDPDKARCYQVMEAADRGALQVWMDRWSDLIDFEVVPVLTSREYWAKFGGAS